MFILIRISDSIKDNSPALFHLRQIHPGTGYGKFLNSYIELITEKLSEGEGVSIHYFGKLVPHYQTERPGRNLRTGEECKIRARTSVKFKASEILIQKLNPGK